MYENFASILETVHIREVSVLERCECMDSRGLIVFLALCKAEDKI